MNILSTMAKPDNKYYIFLFFIALNALTYSVGSHDSAFLSTSFICAVLVYFDYKTQTMLQRTFERERDLIKDLEKVTIVVSKLPAHERDKFQEMYRSL